MSEKINFPTKPKATVHMQTVTRYDVWCEFCSFTIQYRDKTAARQAMIEHLREHSLTNNA